MQPDILIRTATGKVTVKRSLRISWKLYALLDPLKARQERHCNEISRSGRGSAEGERSDVMSWLVEES